MRRPVRRSTETHSPAEGRALDGPVPVFGGFALTITTLSKGTHSLSAVFTPTDPAAFAPSSAAPVLLTVDPLLSRVTLR